MSIVDHPRLPTPEEEAHFGPNPVPGGLFANPCPLDAPVRRFHVVGIQREIKYNTANWHDLEGRLYVLEEDKEAVVNGEKEPEPLSVIFTSAELGVNLG